MPDLAALLTGPTAQQALADRDITAVFRILRDAGVSQAAIARATGQQQSEVSAIVSGRQVQSVLLLERIADGLGVPRGWMGLAHAHDLESEPLSPEDGESEDERRDNLFRHAATVLYGKPVFGAVKSIRVMDAPTPVPRRIGLGDVKQVAATTERLGQLVGDLGGISMTEALTAHTRASEALFGAAMREPVRQQLLVALADAHRTAGSAAAGAGLGDLAREHNIRSMDCAAAAGDMLRAVVSLDHLGHTELQAEPNEALKLFQLGAATAPSPLPCALVEYDCALALSLLGLTEESLATLRRARVTYQAASDEPRPWKYFAAALPHTEGRVYLALGYFDRAVVAFAEAEDGASHAVGCSMDNFGHLAAAQLRCGELRSGLRTAERAISLARGLRSVSVRDNLAPLQEAAAARRDSACQDLAHELSTLRSAA
ncbi:MAG: helix-turn-helix transcriptional regulator [Actinomycetota bacterium]|nr:helix-turn-helix transcriptional regulator [Actinomycetota bacterium]